MKFYTVKLKYKNTYHNFEFELSGDMYKKVNNEWVRLKPELSDVDDDFILFFENFFTPYLRRVTYNDIVFSDEYELEIYSYETEEDLLIVHKVTWLQPVKKDYIHIIKYSDGEYSSKYLEREEGIKKLKELGLKMTTDLGA